MTGRFQGRSNRAPFGQNEFLRSTKNLKPEGYTFYAPSCPTTEVDGVDDQKILQPGVAIAKITSGAGLGMVGPRDAGASDGRQTVANLVGLCYTFLPWQLLERDCEIAVLYDCTAIQDNCLEVASGEWVALTDTTAAALNAEKGVNILFAQGSSEIETVN